MNNEKKIKIGLVANSLQVGGLEKVVVNILNYINRDRFDPFLICLHERQDLWQEVRDPSIPVYDLHFNNTLKLFNLYKLNKTIKKEKPDILHPHNVAPLFYSVAVERLKKNLNIVYTAHNYLKGLRKRQIQRFHLYARKVDRFVVVSDQLKDYFSEFVSPAQMEVVYNGIPDPMTLRDQAKATQYRQQFRENFIIGLVANLIPQKGLEYLLQSVPVVLESIPEAVFLIVGDGPERNPLEKMAMELGVADKVYFLGKRLDAVNWISIFDVFVLSSLWEGLPIVLLEAMGLGKPMVVTDVGGNSILVKNGWNGFVVPPRNIEAFSEQIVRLYQSDHLRKEFGMNSRKYFEQSFRVESMVSHYEKIYEEIYGRRE